MSISRRQLEAAGLPIGGDFAQGLTRREAGRVIYGGGGDSSSSSSSTSNPQDNRIAAAPGSVSVSGAGSAAQLYVTDRRQEGAGNNIQTAGNVSITQLDGGAITAARSISERAIDLTATSTRLASQNITELLNTADDLAGRYATATGRALDVATSSTADALDFARSNDARFVSALEALTDKTISVAQRAQSDVVGAYQNSADTTSGVRQIVMGGLVIAGIVAVAALKGKL